MMQQWKKNTKLTMEIECHVKTGDFIKSVKMFINKSEMQTCDLSMRYELWLQNKSQTKEIFVPRVLAQNNVNTIKWNINGDSGQILKKKPLFIFSLINSRYFRNFEVSKQSLFFHCRKQIECSQQLWRTIMSKRLLQNMFNHDCDFFSNIHHTLYASKQR